MGSNGNYWSATQNNENNAYNVNFNSGNLNPANNNNRNNGYAVRLVQDFADEDDTLLTDLFKAYYDARRNKRNTRAQLRFELNLERNLIALYRELRDGTYRPEPCICFIVHDPVQREVFASSFRDRVVHHLYYNYVSPLFERLFICDSYSCRKGKGTLYGIERLEHHLRSATLNYRRTVWVMKLDLQGYFMSIDRRRLCSLVQEDLRCHWRGSKAVLQRVLWLTEVITGRDPMERCRVVGHPRDWEGLPESKTLRGKLPGVGLPIGDLTSQLFSNVFLNRLDQYVKRRLGVVHYGRYVDDMFLIGPTKRAMLRWRVGVKSFVASLGMRLHPLKQLLHDSWRSIAFLGAVLRPWQRYASRRTVTNWRQRVKCWEHQGRIWSGRWVEACVRSIRDSYVGYFGHYRAGYVLS